MGPLRQLLPIFSLCCLLLSITFRFFFRFCQLILTRVLQLRTILWTLWPAARAATVCFRTWVSRLCSDDTDLNTNTGIIQLTTYATHPGSCRGCMLPISSPNDVLRNKQCLEWVSQQNTSCAQVGSLLKSATDNAKQSEIQLAKVTPNIHVTA